MDRSSIASLKREKQDRDRELRRIRGGERKLGEVQCGSAMADSESEASLGNFELTSDGAL